MRFRSPVGLVYPAADVLEVRPQADAPPDVTVGMMGLTGPSGVLPRYYSEIVTQALRARSAELRDFMDLLAHRFVAFFARGGAKYRPARTAEVRIPARRRAPGHRRPGPPRADRLRHAASDRQARRGLRTTAALRRAVRPPAALGGSPGRHAVRLARHACGGGGICRRLAAITARPTHPPVRQRRLVPAQRRCRCRRAGLGPSGSHHPACRTARPAGLPAVVAEPGRAPPTGLAGARLCRFRAGVRHQSGPRRPPGAPATAECPG